jgi:hypothetical protein
MHDATFHFIASQTGAYEYLCPVPGSAKQGMMGRLFVVENVGLSISRIPSVVPLNSG